ncbi:MAG: hypothetical protein K0R39_3674 [Symbiobacteriaceae bacterium]|jgi:hypothetical protein|nr:hypothetical protein [Symbiobacteriaceae bacterium]
MKWFLSVLTAVAMLVAGCGGGKESAGSVVVVLIDMTTSASADANTYMKNFTEVLNGLAGGEEIFVVPITGSLVPKIATQAALPAKSSNPVSDAKKLKEARLKLQQDVAALLKGDRPQEPGTAILSGIQKAGAIFAAEGQGRPRTLVILSDMIEQGQIDFTTASLTPVAPVLDQLAKGGLVPQLDAKVYVAGITTGQAQGYQVPQEKFQEITRFWAAYFERAGAELGPYDRDLLNFQVKR